MTVVRSEIKGFIKDLKSSRKEDNLIMIRSGSVGGLEEWLFEFVAWV